MLNEKIIKICEQKFINLNYSNRTKDNYISHIKKFIESINDKQIIHLNSNDFQNYLDNYSFTSISQQNQIINSIRFLYKEVLNKKYDKVSFKRPRKEKHLPRVIDSKELINKISKIENVKHKTILSLAYSTGMRVSEIVNLRISNIDSKRMLIHIENGKSIKAVMRYRGKGLNKEMWFSICSMHFEHNKDCNMCNVGHWQKVWRYKLSSAFYKLFPKLWRWWINK